MAVRRQIDQDPRSVSLLRLLYDIRGYPHLLSRQRHVARYVARGLRGDLGNREFDGFAGHGEPHLNVKHVQPDINRLTSDGKPRALRDAPSSTLGPASPDHYSDVR